MEKLLIQDIHGDELCFPELVLRWRVLIIDIWKIVFIGIRNPARVKPRAVATKISYWYLGSIVNEGRKKIRITVKAE